MACPDELTLDLWQAGALRPDDAATVGAHASTCQACTATLERWQALDVELHGALSLDHDEQAYLDGLKLPAAWRPEHAPAGAAVWLTLLAIPAVCLAWFVAAPFAAQAWAAAAQVGVGTILVRSLLGVLLGVGEAVLALSRGPLVGSSQLALALLAVALLAWPRRLARQPAMSIFSF